MCFPALASAQPNLASYDSRFYTIRTDVDRAVAAEFARHMDLVFAEYHKRFSSFRMKDGRKMAIYLFNDRAGYMAHLASEGVDATNSGGMFVPRNAGLYTWVDKDRASTIAVLQHEGFHQFAWTFLGRTLPPWANEGMAEYFEDGILIKGKMHLGRINPSRLALIQDALHSDEPMASFEELIGMDGHTWSQTLHENPQKSGLLYAYAWSVAHFLIHANNGRYAPAFGKYLEFVADGQPSVAAFRKAFGSSDLGPMRKKWVEYVTALKPDELTLAVTRMRMLAGGIVWMRAQDQPTPESIDQLRDALGRVQYRWRFGSHGSVTEISSGDAATYKYTDERGAEHDFEFTAAAGDGLPPGIIARNLKPTPVVVWVKDGDELRPDIQFR